MNNRQVAKPAFYSGTPTVNEVVAPPKFQITLELTEDQTQKLLDFCREHEKPVNDVGTAAIADYISRSASELVKVLSLD